MYHKVFVDIWGKQYPKMFIKWDFIDLRFTIFQFTIKLKY